jgi:hypothetical protein
MTKSRRRAGWLVVGLLGVGLLMGSVRDGWAGPFRWWEPPTPPVMGDPDIPNGSPNASKGQIEVRVYRLGPSILLTWTPRAYAMSDVRKLGKDNKDVIARPR